MYKTYEQYKAEKEKELERLWRIRLNGMRKAAKLGLKMPKDYDPTLAKEGFKRRMYKYEVLHNPFTVV